MTGNWPIRTDEGGTVAGNWPAFANTRTDEGGTVAGNWPLPIQGQTKVGLWQGIGLCQYKDR